MMFLLLKQKWFWHVLATSLLGGSSQDLDPWLITMVIVSHHKWGYSPCKWPKWLVNRGDPNHLLTGMILQVWGGWSGVHAVQVWVSVIPLVTWILECLATWAELSNVSKISKDRGSLMVIVLETSSQPKECTQNSVYFVCIVWLATVNMGNSKTTARSGYINCNISPTSREDIFHANFFWGDILWHGDQGDIQISFLGWSFNTNLSIWLVHPGTHRNTSYRC